MDETKDLLLPHWAARAEAFDKVVRLSNFSPRRPTWELAYFIATLMVKIATLCIALAPPAVCAFGPLVWQIHLMNISDAALLVLVTMAAMMALIWGHETLTVIRAVREFGGWNEATRAATFASSGKWLSDHLDLWRNTMLGRPGKVSYISFDALMSEIERMARERSEIEQARKLRRGEMPWESAA